MMKVDVSPLLAKVIETELYNHTGDIRGDELENIFEDVSGGDADADAVEEDK